MTLSGTLSRPSTNSIRSVTHCSLPCRLSTELAVAAARQQPSSPDVPRALRQAVNREFGEGEESQLRASLAAGGVLTVPYKCNRAVLFVSDQYHESLPFRFAPGKAPRVHLRQSAPPKAVAPFETVRSRHEAVRCERLDPALHCSHDVAPRGCVVPIRHVACRRRLQPAPSQHDTPLWRPVEFCCPQAAHRVRRE